MAALERTVRSATLEPELLELVRIKASQINGCTYCLAMHNRAPAPAASIRPGWTPSPPGGDTYRIFRVNTIDGAARLPYCLSLDLSNLPRPPTRITSIPSANA